MNSVLHLFMPLQVSAVRKAMLCCNLVDRCSFLSSFPPLGATRLTRKPIPKLSPTNTHVMTCNQLRSTYGLALSNTPAELKRRIFCNRDHHKLIACEIHGRAQTHCHKLYMSMKRSALPSPWDRPASLWFTRCCLCFVSLDRFAWWHLSSQLEALMGKQALLHRCVKQKCTTARRDKNTVIKSSWIISRESVGIDWRRREEGGKWLCWIRLDVFFWFNKYASYCCWWVILSAARSCLLMFDIVQ